MPVTTTITAATTLSTTTVSTETDVETSTFVEVSTETETATTIINASGACATAVSDDDCSTCCSQYSLSGIFPSECVCISKKRAARAAPPAAKATTSSSAATVASKCSSFFAQPSAFVSTVCACLETPRTSIVYSTPMTAIRVTAFSTARVTKTDVV